MSLVCKSCYFLDSNLDEAKTEMRIIITGGAGFIGSAIVRYIINSTQDGIMNIDNLTYAGNLQNLVKVAGNERHIFREVDICNKIEIENIFHDYQPDAVMHLAAESHVDRSISSPDQFIKTNVFGTYNLLAAATSYLKTLPNDRAKKFRFHHVSTDEVYGELPHPDETANATDVKFTENTPYAPSSPYSATKASSDHLVRAWHRTYNLPTLITNCSNNYGPYQFPEKLIPVVISRAIKGKSLPIYGKGDQIRDWLHVEDHADALYHVLKNGKVGETYNIGGNSEKSNLEIVLLICKILQEIRPIDKFANNHQYSDLIQFVQDRPGHDRRYAIDATKIKSELGWVPKEDFESGLRKTVEWYLQNLTWCESVVS